MMEAPKVRRAHSLRGRLIWFLLAVILLTAIVQGVVAYRSARAEADQIFDYHMQQMALSLRSGMPIAGFGPPVDDSQDPDYTDFVVQVWTADGLRIFQSAPRTRLPDRAILGFSDVAANGTTYRVFSMQTHSQVIQVAQDMATRQQMASALAFRTVAPIAIVAPLLMLAVWWVVSASLTPVARIRSQIAARQSDDLSEVSENDLPEEIQPLVHELNLLLGRMRLAFDAQKRLVADAAHELRSPLAALKLQVQGLQRASDDATRDVAITRLAGGIDRATRLVDQLLELARQQEKAVADAPLPHVDLATIARAAVADAASSAQLRNIDLGLNHADAGDIGGYDEGLRVLTRNLIDNAVKYSPAGGVVDVEVRRVGERFCLSVDDSGPGIVEGDRERVLDRFYRVVGNEANGSGLGLAIVKAITDMHGAQLSLQSSAKHGGLRVEVLFPALR